MTSRVLITGGAGFIGAGIVRALVARGDGVVVFDSGAAAGFANVTGTGAEIVEADLLDLVALERALARCDAIVHLAAQTNVPESIAEPMSDGAVNVGGSMAVLEAARTHGINRFVFASSNAVVAGHPPPTNEEMTPNPVAPYGAAKASVEAYLRAYGAAYGLEGVALRFANAYGPRSAHKSSVVSAFVRAYLSGGPLVIRGDGHQTRDFVYVSDIAAAVLACLDASAEAVAGEVFQVGTGRETSLLDLAETLFEVGGRSVPIAHQQPSAGDVPRNVSDISKARRVLGYEPRVDLRDGLAETLEWFRAYVP